ncbi:MULTISPECIES: Sec-independent protein translocase subunit TatA/TatB [unclassified Saccharicrinis]|uniref:Sec-independent protein translocase subunit TatA/TatB n=1 Tax=unclassified Saccharicrinis TaxID=2646859 RepID=UPI003D3452CE
MYFGLFSFGGGEIFIVLIAVLVLFGANKIPELARMLGKGMNEFRRATDDIKREFREGADEFKKDLEDSKKDIDNHIHEIGETFTEQDDYDPYEDLDEDENEDKTSKDVTSIEENTSSDDKTDPESFTQPRPNKSDKTETE